MTVAWSYKFMENLEGKQREPLLTNSKQYKALISRSVKFTYVALVLCLTDCISRRLIFFTLATQHEKLWLSPALQPPSQKLAVSSMYGVTRICWKTPGNVVLRSRKYHTNGWQLFCSDSHHSLWHQLGNGTKSWKAPWFIWNLKKVLVIFHIHTCIGCILSTNLFMEGTMCMHK